MKTAWAVKLQILTIQSLCPLLPDDCTMQPQPPHTTSLHSSWEDCFEAAPQGHPSSFHSVPWERSATKSVVRRVAWFKVKTAAITRWISLAESIQSAKWSRLVLAATEQRFLQTHNGATSIHVVFLPFLSCAKCDECWRDSRKWIWSLSARRWTDAKPMCVCLWVCVCVWVNVSSRPMNLSVSVPKNDNGNTKF